MYTVPIPNTLKCVCFITSSSTLSWCSCKRALRALALRAVEGIVIHRSVAFCYRFTQEMASCHKYLYPKYQLPDLNAGGRTIRSQCLKQQEKYKDLPSHVVVEPDAHCAMIAVVIGKDQFKGNQQLRLTIGALSHKETSC